MNSIKLYFKYCVMNMRCKMQYKAWPFLILSVMINSTIDFLGIRILFTRFGSLGYWTAHHTLMVYGIACTSFGMAEWFSRGYDVFPWQVRSGHFDKMLLRPRSTFLQVIGEKFEFERCGRIIIGISCIIASASALEIAWSINTILCILGAIVGGYLIYTGVMIIFASISFYTVGAIDVAYAFTNHTLQYAQIPFHTMPKFIKHILTFIFPIALCYYYPVTYIVRMDSRILSFIALPIGVLFFVVSLGIWIVSTRKYHSTGS